MIRRAEMTTLVAIATFAIVISQGLASPASLDRSPTTQQPSTRKPAYKDGNRESAGNLDLFAYPAEPSTVDSKNNARNRTPVFIPNRCQENEILYPGDQDSDWVCDCKPTYVYHPPTRKCYQMYTQGYCPEGTMISLKIDAKHPECIPNQCANSNVPEPKVLFNNTCVTLNEKHEYCKYGELHRVIGIDENTNELACVNLTEIKLRPMDEKLSYYHGTDQNPGQVAHSSNNEQPADFRGTSHQG